MPTTIDRASHNEEFRKILGAHVEEGAIRHRNKIFKTGMNIATGIIGDDEELMKDFKRYSGSNDLLGLIRDTSSGESNLIRKKLAESSDVFANMYKVSSMSTDELMNVQPGMLGFGRDAGGKRDLGELKRAIGSFDPNADPQKRSRDEYARQAFQLFLQANPSAAAELKTNRAEKESQLFERAATILDKLAEKLGVGKG